MLAGSGEAGFKNGPAAVARFNWITGVCQHLQDNFVVAGNNHAIHLVDGKTGEPKNVAKPP